MFRRIQAVFTPYAADRVQQSVDPVTGVVTGSVAFTSPLFLPQTYTVTTAPTSGTVTVNANGTYTYTPSAAARQGTVSSDGFTVTASNFFSSASSTVSVPISRTNQAPVAGATYVTNPGENGVVLGQVSATDPNGDPITYTTAATSTLGGTVVALNDTGGFVYTPTAQARHDAAATGAPASALSDSFTITASDGRGGVTPIVVSVPVSPADAAPVPGTTTVNPAGTNGVVTGTVSVIDADGDHLTYTGPTGTTANGGTVTTTATGGFTYTPSAAAQHAAAGGGPSTDGFTVTADDGHGGSVAVPVSVTIVPTNTSPTATYTAGAPGTTGVVTGAITATDADGDPLTYTGPTTTTTHGGTVVVTSTGAFTYTPSAAARAAAAVGGPTTDTFAVTVADGHGATTTVNVVASISPPASLRLPYMGFGGDLILQSDGTSTVYELPDGVTGGTTALGGTVTAVVAANVNGVLEYTPSAQARANADAGGPLVDVYQSIIVDPTGTPIGFVEVGFPIVPASQQPVLLELFTNVGPLWTDNQGGLVSQAYIALSINDPYYGYIKVHTALGGSICQQPDPFFFTYRSPAGSTTIVDNAVAGGPLLDTGVINVYASGDIPPDPLVFQLGVGIPISLPAGVTVYADVPIPPPAAVTNQT
ncbi:hypothetical protein JCM12141A_20300 [Mycolicibacterium hodleri]